VADLARTASALTVAQTTEIDDARRRLKVPIDEMLLAALSRTIAATVGDGTLAVDLSGEGRSVLKPDIDVRRTVGWFTTVYPVLLQVVYDDPVLSLRRVQERLRRVPGHGLGYGLARYLRLGDPAAARLAELPAPAISFNYLGQFDQSFGATAAWSPSSESTGPGDDARAQRFYLLQIDALILAGELRLTWAYSSRLHQRSTVTALADRCLEVLEALIDDHGTPEAGRYTPADFPELTLSQAELDSLLATLDSR
jgi:non-ribosomal peptide synthase protein (TIGR01720 family)